MEYNKRNARTWSLLGARGTFGLAMQILAENNDFTIVSADLSISSGLSKYCELYPERFINVGIAEQNMIGVAAGIASNGENVFATSFAPFITERCMDQIRMNLGYMRYPVKLIGLSSGFEQGLSGSSHYGLEDAAAIRLMHNITVVTPADCTEIVKVLEKAMSYDNPMYIRLTGGRRVPVVYTEDYDFEIGKGILLKEGKDVLILANGTMVYESIKAAEKLEEHGISASVVDMHTTFPIDEEIIINNGSDKKLIVTVEEHCISGNLGTAVAEVLAEKSGMPKLVRMGISNEFPKAGKHEYMMEKYGLTAQNIESKITEIIKKQ